MHKPNKSCYWNDHGGSSGIGHTKGVLGGFTLVRSFIVIEVSISQQTTWVENVD